MLDPLISGNADTTTLTALELVQVPDTTVITTVLEAVADVRPRNPSFSSITNPALSSADVRYHFASLTVSVVYSWKRELVGLPNVTDTGDGPTISGTVDA